MMCFFFTFFVKRERKEMGFAFGPALSSNFGFPGSCNDMSLGGRKKREENENIKTNR